MPTKIFIKTYGCSHNISDSEVMAGLLKEAQFEITDNEEDANLVLINSCTVKNKSQSNFFNYLEKAKQTRKPVVVAGCIPQSMPEILGGLPMLGTKQISNVVSVVEEALNENPIAILKDEPQEKRLNLPKIRNNPVREIIPILDGCLSACTFCLTKKARGWLKSFPQEEILQQAEQAIKEGVKEIWLSSEDNGCYGFDMDTNLAKLVASITKIPGNFKIRVGMGNPQHFMKYLPELIQILKHEKVYKFIHIPLQSGSNKVLKEMKRNYTSQQWKEVAEKIRQEIPEITIATDIIAGFPGESEKDFLETIKMLKETKPEVVNISRYGARPGTEAAERKDQIPGEVSKERSRYATNVFEHISYEKNKLWKNWHGEIVITEKGKDESWVGRTPSYKPVIVHGNFKLGDTLKVKAQYATTWDIRADVL